MQGGFLLKKILCIALVFVLALSLSVPCFAESGTTALCPTCGNVLDETIRNRPPFVDHYYTCHNGDGYSSVVTEVLGYKIQADGIVPQYVDGNVYYSVNANKLQNSGAYLPNGEAIIRKDGVYRVPMKMTGGTLVDTSSFNCAVRTDYSITVNFPNTISADSLKTFNYYVSNTSSMPVVFSADLPFLGTWVGRCYTQTNNSILAYAGERASESYSSGLNSCSINSCTYTGSGVFSKNAHTYFQEKMGFYYVGATPCYARMEWYMECEPSNIAVTDNSYVNTTNKTFTAGGQTVTYDNAYYNNGTYYIYTNSGNTCTTYYTDNSGQIIGNVTTDNNTSNVTYNITVYNVAPPSDSGSSGTSGGSGSTSGGSGSNGSGSSGSNIWGALGNFFGTVLGGALDVLGTAIIKILDILSKLVTQVVESIKTLLTSLLESLNLLLDFGTGFGDFLKQFFYWLPPQIVAIFVTSISLGIVLAILKFFRGH